jgi:hypothetical protein
LAFRPKIFKIINANIAAQKNILLDDFLKMSFTQIHPEEEKQLIE